MADRSRVEITARLRGVRKFQGDAKAVSRSVDNIGDAAERTDARIMGLNARATLLRNALGLAKPAALATGLGLAAQGATALAGGALAAGSALAPLSGLMVAYPGLGFAAAQGIGAFAFAMNGVLDAVGGLRTGLDPKKLGLLSDEGQRFAIALDAMKSPIRAIQSQTQAGLFPGLTKALGIVRPELHRFQSEAKATGDSLGGIAVQAAGFVRSSGHDLQTLAGRNALYLGRMGSAGVHLAGALTQVLVAAGPLLGWLTKGAVHLSVLAERFATTGRETGKLQGFFWRTRQVASQLARIIVNVGSALFQTGRAASDLGGDMLDGLETASMGWNRWASSTKGQGDMRRYFAEMKPAIWEIARLVRDVTKAVISLGKTPGLAPLLKQVRTELLPILTQVVASTTSSFGPVMIDAAANVAQLLGALAGGVGPLTLMVQGLGLMARALTWVAKNVPGAKQLITVLATLGLASKLMPFAAWITGFSKVKAGVGAAVGAYRSLQLGMEAMRAVYIANTGVTNASSLAVLRHVAATRLAAAGARVMALAQGALNLVMSANPIVLVAAAIAAVGAAFYLAYTKVKWFHDAVDSVFGFIKGHWPLLAPLFGPLGIAVALLVGHFRTLKSIATSVASALKTGVGGALKWIGDQIGGLLDKIGKLTGALDSIPGIGIAKKGAKLLGGIGHAAGGIAKKLPGLATGGVVRTPGATLVGEHGPELLSLDRGARVDPLPRLVRGLSDRREQSSPSIGGALADADTRAVEVTVPVHLDGRVIYEAVGRVARDRASRK